MPSMGILECIWEKKNNLLMIKLITNLVISDFIVRHFNIIKVLVCVCATVQHSVNTTPCCNSLIIYFSGMCRQVYTTNIFLEAFW